MATNSDIHGWKVEHPCPQCGAQVVLDETDRILQCEYCRNRLYVLPDGNFRYFLAPKRSAPDLFYLPYWRFRGMVFQQADAGRAGRVVDSNLLALKMPWAPASLGVRPQVLRLRYAGPGVEGAFLTPQIPCRTLAAACHGGCSPHAPSSTFIGETQSLIYSPVSVRGDFLYDAVLERPICQLQEPLDELPAEPAGRKDGISFVPTLCPACGWDLEGEKDSLVLLCRNCGSGYQAGRAGLERVEFGFARAPDPGTSTTYLPFWKLSADVDGLELKSYADLARIANLPRAVQGAWEKREPHFWFPAFKIQPHLFLRLSKSMTLLEKEPEMDPGAKVPGAPVFPATLPLAEAEAGLKLLLGAAMPARKPIASILEKVNFTLTGSSLMYVPFISRGEEFILPGVSMSIQRNALFLGRLI